LQRKVSGFSNTKRPRMYSERQGYPQPNRGIRQNSAVESYWCSIPNGFRSEHRYQTRIEIWDWSGNALQAMQGMVIGVIIDLMLSICYTCLDTIQSWIMFKCDRPKWFRLTENDVLRVSTLCGISVDWSDEDENAQHSVPHNLESKSNMTDERDQRIWVLENAVVSRDWGIWVQWATKV
jgi:hypothetical protein